MFITYDCLDRPDIITLLSGWRKKHELWFQAQFPVTEERTKQWLRERVLDVNDRLLFMIEVDHTFFGHAGLFRFDEHTLAIDIDNIVRGKDGYRGIMSETVKLLMDWGRDTLGIRTYKLQTTSDNEKAIALYRRLGFTEIKRIPMTYQKTENGGEWIQVTADKHQPIGRYEVFMEKKVA